MTKEQIKELTAEYNNKRRSLKFLTIAASEDGVESVLRLNPYIEDLDREQQIVHIARFISDLAFG